MTNITGTGNQALLGLLQAKRTSPTAAPSNYNPTFLMHVSAQMKSPSAAATAAAAAPTTVQAPVIASSTANTPESVQRVDITPGPIGRVTNFIGDLL